MEKKFFNEKTIQVNLVPNPMWRRHHKFTRIVVIKFFAISLLL